MLSPFVTFCLLGTVVPFQHNGSCDYDCFPHQNRNNQRIAIRDLLICQKSPNLRLDSGSSGWCEWYPDAAGAKFAEAGLLELKGYCFPCQHLIHSHGASSNAFTVFYAAATALEMPV